MYLLGHSFCTLDDHGRRSSIKLRSLSSMCCGISVSSRLKYSKVFIVFAFAVSTRLYRIALAFAPLEDSISTRGGYGGSDRASSKGYIVRWVEAPSNKLLITAFEASLESVTVTRRLSVDSKIAGIAMEHRNPKVSEGRHRGQGGRQYMHLSLW